MESRSLLGRIHDLFPVVALGRRLAAVLVAVAAYSAFVWTVEIVFDIHPQHLGVEGSLINSLIVGLLLGFRNRAAYDRWWEARRLWGQLTNDIRNLASQLAAFVPGETLAASPIAPLLNAFPWALKLHLRGRAPRLQEIPGFERHSDDPDHVPLYLAGHIYLVVSEWEREGFLDQAKLLTLAPQLRGLMDVCGGCERIKNTPLSPWYTGLLRTGIVLHLAIAPWYTMSEFGVWGLPMLLLVSFLFLGVELVDTIVEEPFGSERDDLALERYCETMRLSVAQCLPLPSKTEEPSVVAG